MSSSYYFLASIRSLAPLSPVELEMGARALLARLMAAWGFADIRLELLDWAVLMRKSLFCKLEAALR
jgi:hypothetical protein